MLNNVEFDLWANNYDKTVTLSQEANEYPFAGYKDVLNYIYNTIKQSNENKILDIGFGTGILSKKLYDDGYNIFGIDFSENMINIAKNKMPKAHLLQYDFCNGFPTEFKNEIFDFIICTYSIHHLENNEKIKFINQLLSHISKSGKILIGDVAFKTIAEMKACENSFKNLWDKDEVYPIEENLKPFFQNLKFNQLSFCAGVFTITK